MFCDRCGASMPAEQRYCGRCGKELFGPLPSALPAPGRVQEHVRLLGIFWLAISAFNAVGCVVLFILANTLFAHGRHFSSDAPGPAFLQPLLGFIGVVILLKSAAGFLAGYGLLKRETWARMLTIVLSFLSLFNVPFGTALGIYGLWILLPATSEREYEAEVRRAQAA